MKYVSSKFLVRKLSKNDLESKQRAMLRLVKHKFLQNQVTKFREIHPIAIDQLVLSIRSSELSYQKRKNQNSEQEEETSDKGIKLQTKQITNTSKSNLQNQRKGNLKAKYQVQKIIRLRMKMKPY